jgi:hypothetical protein
MSDLAFIENGTDATCCVNYGCGNRFDPAREGFNGECDDCAALAADHFCGLHSGMQFDCRYCWADVPVRAGRALIVAA